MLVALGRYQVRRITIVLGGAQKNERTLTDALSLCSSPNLISYSSSRLLPSNLPFITSSASSTSRSAPRNGPKC